MLSRAGHQRVRFLFIGFLLGHFGWPATKALAQEGLPKYVGLNECQTCHGGGAVQYPNLINSFQIWVQEDQHSKAYDHLRSDLGLHVAEWMGLPLEPGQEANWEKCVRCHMVNAPPERRSPSFNPATEGIGCEACHGPAEDYLVPHKSQSYAENLKVGLADLKDLRTRARRCLDCHAGLDHEIAAAGHPDLNFEFFHFSFWQPPHWNYEEASPLKFWAIGQVAALERTVEHLIEDSKLYRPIPEFEEKSCYNCHHKLDQDRWRQTEAHAAAVLPMVKNLLGPERADRLQAELEEFRIAAVEAFPDGSGGSKDLETVGKNLTAGWVDEVSAALSAKPLSPDLLKALLRDLTEPLPSVDKGVSPHLPLVWMVQNFNTAEQVYLGIQSLIYAVPGKVGSPNTETLTGQAFGEGGSAQFKESLEGLYDFLKYRKIEARSEAFETEGFNRGLEAVRDDIAN